MSSSVWINGKEFSTHGKLGVMRSSASWDSRNLCKKLPLSVFRSCRSLWPWQHCLDHIFPRMKPFLQTVIEVSVWLIPPIFLPLLTFLLFVSKTCSTEELISLDAFLCPDLPCSEYAMSRVTEVGPLHFLLMHIFLQIKLVAKSRESGISLSALPAHQV